MIDKTWKWFLNEWQERNKKMHGVDEIARAQRERDTATRKVRWLCNLKDKAMPAHQDVCCKMVEEHCKNMMTSQMKTWNNMSGPMLTSSAKCAEANGMQGTRPTNHWFPMTPDTTPEHAQMTHIRSIMTLLSQVDERPVQTEMGTRRCR